MHRLKRLKRFSNMLSPVNIDRAFFVWQVSLIEKGCMNCSTIKMIVMKFLLIMLAIRFVFFLLDQIGEEKEFNMDEYEDGPSEHNVWW